MKFSYFTDTTKKGFRGWKEAQRQGDFLDFSNRANYFMPHDATSWSLLGPGVEVGLSLSFIDYIRLSLSQVE